MSKLFFSLRVSAPTKKSTVKNVKGFIYYIAKRSGVEFNKGEVANLSTEQLAEKLFNDPLVQTYFNEGTETDVDSEKQLIDKFVTSGNANDLADGAKMQMMYIAKRTGVVFNQGGHHGLFGKIGDNDFGDIQSLRDTMNYVGEKIASENMVTYSSVISFSPEDATEQGYDNQEKFKLLLQENICQIAEKIGVPPSRLEYVGAVHLKKENPHMHFIFWDKAQQIKQPFVHPTVARDIREDLINAIYKDDFIEYYAIKNTARKNLTQNFSFDNQLNPAFVKQFTKEFANISKRLPKTGSLKFEYLDPLVKRRIIKTVKKLVEQNDDIKTEYNRFVNTAVDIAKMYSNKPERHEQARKNAEDDILKRMSNKLIRAIKDTNKYDHTRSKSEQKKSTGDIVLSLFRFLAQSRNDISNRHNHEKGELSKQARIDLAKKMEFASDLDWGEER